MESSEIDKLSGIMLNFPLQAKVFFSGNLCELSDFEEPQGSTQGSAKGSTQGSKGHLHILHKGLLTVIDESGQCIDISPPCLLFFPQGRKHRLQPDTSIGANLVCATIEFGELQQHPILQALPHFLRFSLREQKHQRLAITAQWIFNEAFANNDGKQLMLNKLCDIFIVQILREVIENTDIQQGMLAGLAHPQLALALKAIHSAPENPWRVSSLASLAMMSRAKFAQIFLKVVGQTPLDYVSDWRLQKAQTLLLKGFPVYTVALEVGYDSGSALARVFKKKLSKSPKQWLKENT